MTLTNTIAEMEATRANAGAMADLSATFFETETFRKLSSRILGVLEAREANLIRGEFEQKGACLIGPSGSGKSRMVKEAIRRYQDAAVATGGRKYGHEIVSAIVPGKASVKDTCRAVLNKLDYPTKGERTEDYWIGCLKTQLEHRCIAGLHLDEVQDAGRYANDDTMQGFVKRFRNMMQDGPWSVCLILTSTCEGRDLINFDPTLARRLRPIEIRPMTVNTDGLNLKEAAKKLVASAELSDRGLFDEPAFMPLFMHAAAYRFGVAVEIVIEAIGEALSEGDNEINLDHFAEAYFVRTDCDEEMNPFISDHWRGIDATVVLDRYKEEKPEARKRTKRK
jgi:hypothetical protein